MSYVGYKLVQISKKTNMLENEKAKYLALPLQGGATEENSTDYKAQVINNTFKNPDNNVVNLHVNS